MPSPVVARMMGGQTSIQRAIALLRFLGTSAHIWVAGASVPVQSLTAGNYLDSAGTTLASVDGIVGLDLDAMGGGSPINLSQATTANKPYLRRGTMNYVLNSEDFNNGTWQFVTNITRTFGQLAPDGTSTAWRLTATGNNGNFQSQNLGLTGVGSTGAWFRRVTGTGTVRLDRPDGGTFTSGNIESQLSASWTYLVNPQNGYSLSGLGGRWGVELGTSGDAIEVWHPMFNLGSTTAPYVPTTTAPASSATGPYHWDFDSTDLLSGTFPAGYESATIIDAVTGVGQTTLQGQNVVGTYSVQGGVGSTELVGNPGPFTVTTGYTGYNASVSVVSGALRITHAGAVNCFAEFGVTGLTIGKTYRFKFEIAASNTDPSWGLMISSGSQNGSYAYLPNNGSARSFVFVALGTTVYCAAFGSYVAAGALDISEFSVREVLSSTSGRIILKDAPSASDLATLQQFAKTLAGV